MVDEINFLEIEIPSPQYKVLSAGKYKVIESKRKLVIPEFSVDGKKLSPNQLSEGTFKTLALVFYVITDRSKLLLIEEPEVSIHHGLLNSVMEIIRNEAQDKQIVLTTHSDFVLDKINPEKVQLVTRDAKKGTNVKSITKSMKKNEFKALKEYLNECGTLGEYWREGGLE